MAEGSKVKNAPNQDRDTELQINRKTFPIGGIPLSRRSADGDRNTYPTDRHMESGIIRTDVMPGVCVGRWDTRDGSHKALLFPGRKSA